MNCRHARIAISAWQDGELEPERAGNLAGHLSGCASCRDEARAMRRLMETIPVPEKTIPSKDFLTTVLRRVRERETSRFPRSARSLAMAAAMLFLLAASYAAGMKIGRPAGSLPGQAESMEEIYRSVLNLSLLDSLAAESIEERYREIFNGEGSS